MMSIGHARVMEIQEEAAMIEGHHDLGASEGYPRGAFLKSVWPVGHPVQSGPKGILETAYAREHTHSGSSQRWGTCSTYG